LSSCELCKHLPVARVYIVEDSADIAELIRHYLERAGHETTVFGSGRDGLIGARRSPPDLVVLDVMLPGLDGMQVCQALRAELGADDYVTKPFSPKELVARVGALLRRVGRTPPPAAMIEYGPLVVNLDRHEVRVDSQEVKLTAKEFLLLQYLLEHRGRVLSRDRLLTDVWGYQYTGGTRTVDVHVRRLREKVPLLVTSLETVKQFGYRLDDPPVQTP